MTLSNIFSSKEKGVTVMKILSLQGLVSLLHSAPSPSNAHNTNRTLTSQPSHRHSYKHTTQTRIEDCLLTLPLLLKASNYIRILM